MIKSNLFVLCIFISTVYCTSYTWQNNNYNYFDNTNWSPSGSPASPDDIAISKNNSYVVINNSSSVTTFLMNSQKNATMVFVSQAALSAQTAQVEGASTLYVDTPSQTTPALSVSTGTNILANLNFKSGFINAQNLAFSGATVQFGSGTQKVTSNYISLSNTKMTQSSGANTNFAPAAVIYYSSLTSTSAQFTSNNTGVISAMHSTNLTLQSSTFRTNNYFLMETVKVSLTQSNFYAQQIFLVQNSDFYASNSLVSFDNYFTTISTKALRLKNFCLLQSTSTNAKMVATYNAILYFENTIFDMKGSFVLRDNAQLIFADLILPIRPITIKLYDNAKIKYQSSLFGGTSYMRQASTLETNSEEVQPTSDTSTQSNITIPTSATGGINFELNGNAGIEVTNNILDNIAILNNGDGSIVLNNNVTLCNVTIEGSATVTGSVELKYGTAIDGDVLNNGNIFGNGAINGAVTNNGNIGSNQQVNKISINGAFTSSAASTIGILINSATDYSQINITGTFEFLGTVQIRINQDAVIANQVYQIIKYPGQSSYSFNNATVVFNGNPTEDTSDEAQPISFTLISNSDNTLSLKINDFDNTKSKPATNTNNDVPAATANSDNTMNALVIGMSVTLCVSIFVITALVIKKKNKTTNTNNNLEMVSVQ